MAYLSIIVCVLLNAAQTLLSKKFQVSFPPGLVSFTKYNLVNALFACLFLFLLNGFSLHANGPTCIFAAVYALIVINSLVLNLFAFQFVSVNLVTILSTSGTVVISSLFSVIFLNDVPTSGLIVSILLMSAAAILPHIREKTKRTTAALPVCAAYFLISGANAVILKLFTLSPATTDSQSFFLLTNLFIVAAALIALFMLSLTKRASVRELTRPFLLGQTVNIFTRTMLSNLVSLLSVSAIALMSLPVYTVTSSGFNILSSFLLSVLYFKERTSPLKIITLFLAILALVLSVI